MDKESGDYLKSAVKERCYGDENITTYEKEIKINGNDTDFVESAAYWIKKA